jgi:hypothetical protein
MLFIREQDPKKTTVAERVSKSKKERRLDIIKERHFKEFGEWNM